MKKERRHKIFGILGSSLKHSLSPDIHNFLFNKNNLNCSYTIYEINPASLRQAITAIRTLGVDGVNVTFPYKEKVVKYLDKLDNTVDNTKAVNTIKNSDGVLTGYNTDIFGIQRTFSDRLRFNPRRRNIIILGAGGAARACMHTLLRCKPASIIIFNRNIQNALKMVKSQKIIKNSKSEIIVKRMSSLKNLDYNHKTDLIINATSADKNYVKNILTKLSRQNIFKDTAFFDLNYGTRALSGRLPTGITKSVDGLYMLSAQASRSFQIWTEINTKPEDIFNFLAHKLKGVK
jgi:shikimate dehydrogenase